MVFEEVYDVHFEFVWRSLRQLGVSADLVPKPHPDTYARFLAENGVSKADIAAANERIVATLAFPDGSPWNVRTQWHLVHEQCEQLVVAVDGRLLHDDDGEDGAGIICAS